MMKYNMGNTKTEWGIKAATYIDEQAFSPLTVYTQDFALSLQRHNGSTELLLQESKQIVLWQLKKNQTILNASLEDFSYLECDAPFHM